MANRSQSDLAHLERPSISEESVHVDRRMRSEVHVKTQRQPSPPPQHEGLATNMEDLSYANRDMEVEMLREHVALLERNVEKDKDCFVVRTRSYITREDQVQHLVTPKVLSVEGMIGEGRGIGDHPILMGNERRLPLEREQYLHLLTRVEGRSKMGRSLKAQFLILKSL